jgi:hypothetical protein
MNPTVFWIDTHLILALPMFVASYLGGIAAPKSQLRVASIVVPVLALLLINTGPSLGTGRWGTSIYINRWREARGEASIDQIVKALDRFAVPILKLCRQLATARLHFLCKTLGTSASRWQGLGV